MGQMTADNTDEKYCKPWTVTLFEGRLLSGRRVALNGTRGDCINLRDEEGCGVHPVNGNKTDCVNFDKKTRSVNTFGGCVRLYESPDCNRNGTTTTGTFVTLEPNRPPDCRLGLELCSFSGKASSVGSCAPTNLIHPV